VIICLHSNKTFFHAYEHSSIRMTGQKERAVVALREQEENEMLMEKYNALQVCVCVCV